MRQQAIDPTLWQEGLGALAIVGTVIGSPLLRPWYSHWGYADDTPGQALPGDQFVPRPNLQNNRSILIRATPEEVWPWLLQIGQGRGGLYSYVRLENLVGCNMKNAAQVLPELQALAVGDQIRLAEGEGGPTYTVRAIMPNEALILGGDSPPNSWAFILKPTANGMTRLIARYRIAYPRTVANFVMWRLLVDPIHFIMERQMLYGIKARAEQMARAQ
ncbi:MAG: hypothetical protein KDE34_02090 [Anaerolineales bacterium]|nr:hypothetical protein [Anaerolineales bacterium]MCB8960655.1 hypothetical protein [Ardenticatenales bacterium]